MPLDTLFHEHERTFQRPPSTHPILCESKREKNETTDWNPPDNAEEHLDVVRGEVRNSCVHDHPGESRPLFEGVAGWSVMRGFVKSLRPVRQAKTACNTLGKEMLNFGRLCRYCARIVKGDSPLVWMVFQGSEFGGHNKERQSNINALSSRPPTSVASKVQARVRICSGPVRAWSIELHCFARTMTLLAPLNVDGAVVFAPVFFPAQQTLASARDVLNSIFNASH